MKRLSVFVFTMLLGATLAFAQDAGKADTKAPAAETGKKAGKTKKAKKASKKSKKGSTDSSAAPASK